MKTLFISTVILLGCLPVFSQNNNIVDTSFVGIWSRNGQDTFYSKTTTLSKAGLSFQLFNDGTLTLHNDGDLFYGSWWSMNPGFFSMQLTDSVKKADYIWRIIYADETKMKTIVVGFEEIKDYTDNFIGIWREETSEDPEATRWVKAEKLEPSEPGIIVYADGAVSRQLLVKTKKKTKIEVCRTFMLSTREDYFDIQYFSEEMDVILIEGFNLSQKPVLLRRTRMEKLRN